MCSSKLLHKSKITYRLEERLRGGPIFLEGNKLFK